MKKIPYAASVFAVVVFSSLFVSNSALAMFLNPESNAARPPAVPAGEPQEYDSGIGSSYNGKNFDTYGFEAPIYFQGEVNDTWKLNPPPPPAGPVINPPNLQGAFNAWDMKSSRFADPIPDPAYYGGTYEAREMGLPPAWSDKQEFGYSGIYGGLERGQPHPVSIDIPEYFGGAYDDQKIGPFPVRDMQKESYPSEVNEGRGIDCSRSATPIFDTPYFGGTYEDQDILFPPAWSGGQEFRFEGKCNDMGMNPPQFGSPMDFSEGMRGGVYGGQEMAPPPPGVDQQEFRFKGAHKNSGMMNVPRYTAPGNDFKEYGGVYDLKDMALPAEWDDRNKDGAIGRYKLEGKERGNSDVKSRMKSGRFDETGESLNKGEQKTKANERAKFEKRGDDYDAVNTGGLLLAIGAAVGLLVGLVIGKKEETLSFLKKKIKP